MLHLMSVAGLFSGIGGLELPLARHGFTTALLCERWEPASAVLEAHFPGVPKIDDILKLEKLPTDVNVVTAGFPCTDLSQAGRTAGIDGVQSGLVHKVFSLLDGADVDTVVLENVRNMLVLDKGRAMTVLTDEFARLGFRWAYRLVDSRFTGVAQRRHRVIMVASRSIDPARVLFADDAECPDEESDSRWRDDAFGFYWTEGRTGVGWARDAVPPLKGGSGLGIPSPPAVWLPGAQPGQRICTPSIEAAEVLQGFEPGWTAAAAGTRSRSFRWKLVGNAVTVGVGDWIARRLLEPAEPCVEPLPFSGSSWPTAAAGDTNCTMWTYDVSTWPEHPSRVSHLTDVLRQHGSAPLSKRAVDGFIARRGVSSLRFEPKFLEDLDGHSRKVTTSRAA